MHRFDSFTLNSIAAPYNSRIGPLALALMISIANSYAAPAVFEQEKAWSHLLRRASTALDSNEYWIAEPLLKKALKDAENLDSGELDVAKTLGELARLYTVRGFFNEAELYYEEEYSVKVHALGEDDPEVVPAMGKLLKFYLLHGTDSKAPLLSTDLLAIVEGKLREPVSLAAGKVTYKKGMPLTGWAGLAAPPARNPVLEWAITCDDLGTVYRTRGDLDLADRYFKAALDLKATILGKEHLSLANSYESLGEICQDKNDSKEAESYYKDALKCSERVLEPNDPRLYARLDRLAKCLAKSGKYTDAEQLYKRAQNFWKAEPSKYGSESRCLFSLGCLYADQKSYDIAAPILKEALDLAEQYNGPCSIQLVPYLQKYAYVLYYLGQKEQSNQLKARASIIHGDA